MEDAKARHAKLEIMRLELQVAKSEAAKKELDLKIMQHEEDIFRMREHQVLQDQAITNSKAELAKLRGE